jgi:hypothetical protein
MEAPVNGDHDGRQYVGIDLHRRRSVIVRAGTRFQPVAALRHCTGKPIMRVLVGGWMGGELWALTPPRPTSRAVVHGRPAVVHQQE